MTMPVLSKIASLSPSISDTTIQHLLDWEESNDNEMLWARDWWSPCREAGILHGAVTWWNAGCPVWLPQSFQPSRWLGHCYPRLLLELNLRAGKEAGSALGAHLLLVRAPNSKFLYKRRNNNPFSHMLTLEGWRSTALHRGKKLGAASAREGGFFPTKCFTVMWINAQVGWMTELPIERCYKSRKAGFGGCWSEGKDHNTEERTCKPRSIGFTSHNRGLSLLCSEVIHSAN